MNINLPNFVVRSPKTADIPHLVELHNASSRDTLGTNRVRLSQYEALFKDDSVNLDEMMRVVTTVKGRLVAFQRVELEEPFVVNSLKGAVHPDFRGQGIGSALLAWGEATAREAQDKAPDGSRVSLKLVLFDAMDAGRALALGAGYQKVREYIHLRIKFAHQPPKPRWPQGVRPLLVRPQDWPMVGQALGEAFQDHWGELPLDEPAEQSAFVIPPYEPEPDIVSLFSVNDPYWNTRELCFMAVNEAGEVLGSCLCNAKDAEFAEAGRLGSLSVRRPFRGQGIGRALMLHAFQSFYARGTRVVVTDTDAANLTGANFLYTSAGMRVYRREEDYEKVLGDGKELRVMSIGDFV